MSFARDVGRFSQKVERVNARIFTAVVARAHRSIVEGDAATGAPGQPVQTGALRASWQIAFEAPTVATISTNLVYASAIEDGVGPHGPLTLRSAVGGFHSVALTRVGLQRIVEEEARRFANA